MINVVLGMMNFYIMLVFFLFEDICIILSFFIIVFEWILKGLGKFIYWYSKKVIFMLKGGGSLGI